MKTAKTILFTLCSALLLAGCGVNKDKCSECSLCPECAFHSIDLTDDQSQFIELAIDEFNRKCDDAIELLNNEDYTTIIQSRREEGVNAVQQYVFEDTFDVVIAVENTFDTYILTYVKEAVVSDVIDLLLEKINHAKWDEEKDAFRLILQEDVTCLEDCWSVEDIAFQIKVINDNIKIVIEIFEESDPGDEPGTDPLNFSDLVNQIIAYGASLVSPLSDYLDYNDTMELVSKELEAFNECKSRDEAEALVEPLKDKIYSIILSAYKNALCAELDKFAQEIEQGITLEDVKRFPLSNIPDEKEKIMGEYNFDRALRDFLGGLDIITYDLEYRLRGWALGLVDEIYHEYDSIIVDSSKNKTFTTEYVRVYALVKNEDDYIATREATYRKTITEFEQFCQDLAK